MSSKVNIHAVETNMGNKIFDNYMTQRHFYAIYEKMHKKDQKRFAQACRDAAEEKIMQDTDKIDTFYLTVHDVNVCCDSLNKKLV